MADPGWPGSGGAPKEALCPELEWEGAGECPRVWLFGSRSPPNGIGINPPCLPLARAKPRVPLGVFQDARRGGLQLRSDDRWRAGRGGAGRGGGAGRCAGQRAGEGGRATTAPAAPLSSQWTAARRLQAPPSPAPTTVTEFSEHPDPGLGHAPAGLVHPREPGAPRGPA